MSPDDHAVAALRQHDRRALDPLERSEEVIFGLIMALTFTCSISVATSGQQEVREMLIGALGCNLAWGIVDGAMYVITSMVQRARELGLILAVRSVDDATAARLVQSRMSEALAAVADEEWLNRSVARLRAIPAPARRVMVTAADLRGAVAVLLVVLLATLPVAVPFMLIAEAEHALRVSNAVAIVMLFGAGAALARFGGLSRAWLGFAMVVLGSSLVGLTIALGG
jgi:VIT1/CCC1 family predicted Fe2+/Mn2+ transporter